ncbi:MAG: hypothetical protein ACLFQK_00975 [Fibrobacterota bacterium]
MIKTVMTICLCLSAGFPVLSSERRHRGSRKDIRSVKKNPSGEIPVRLDIHLAGGMAINSLFGENLLFKTFSKSTVIDIDGKALLRKSDVKHRIPKKYRGFAGDEIYIGHMLVPNTFVFSSNEEHGASEFYIDWNIIGLKLFNAPKKMTRSSKAFFSSGFGLIAGYHMFKFRDKYYHSPRPGLEARGELHFRPLPFMSFKAFAFQKAYIPDNRDIGGKRENIMPNYSGIGAGIVIHKYMRRRI